eukprot:6767048-Prymnesium_polylepis.1
MFISAAENVMSSGVTGVAAGGTSRHLSVTKTRPYSPACPAQASTLPDVGTANICDATAVRDCFVPKAFSSGEEEVQ